MGLGTNRERQPMRARKRAEAEEDGTQAPGLRPARFLGNVCGWKRVRTRGDGKLLKCGERWDQKSTTHLIHGLDSPALRGEVTARESSGPSS